MQVDGPACIGLGKASDLRPRADVMRWRKTERERLIAARLAIPSELRRERSVRIAARLVDALGAVAGLTVSAYRPLRGEPDLRPAPIPRAGCRARRAHGAARRDRTWTPAALSRVGTGSTAAARRV